MNGDKAINRWPRFDWASIHRYRHSHAASKARRFEKRHNRQLVKRYETRNWKDWEGIGD